jgi:hypothetical protein
VRLDSLNCLRLNGKQVGRHGEREVGGGHAGRCWTALTACGSTEQKWAGMRACGWVGVSWEERGCWAASASSCLSLTVK